MNNLILLSKTCAIIILVCSANRFVQAEDLKQENKQDAEAKPELVLEYSSVFDKYIPFDDYNEIGWKEANDLVGEFGGWREYARLVQEEARKQTEQKPQGDGGGKP